MKTLLRHWPILLLALWFGIMGILLDRAVSLLSEHTTTVSGNLSAPAPWRGSRLFVDPDSCAWLSYARDLRESPHFRVRFTQMDNAPYGRPVHWAQLPIWLLCGIAATLEAAGVPSPASLELAGRILLPLLGFLSFSALWLYLRRRIRPGLAALVVLCAATILFWDFHPLRPDHHGFHLVAAAAFTLPLLFSSFGFAPPTRRNRLPFILSGIFGGIALWLGATVFFFTLAAAALAAALAILSPSPRGLPATGRVGETLPSPRPSDPAAWRLWSLSGALASLFFWLLEYAPGHFSMHLEANHPLYALSFLGIGECLYLLMRFRHDPATRLSPSFLLHAALALSAAAALPGLVLFGPPAWYFPRSPVMLRIHARHIMEFLPLLPYCVQNDYPFLRALLVPILPAVFVLPLLHRPFPRRILFALPFFVVFLLLYLWQNRWDAFASVASFMLLLAFVSEPGAARAAPSAIPVLSRLAPCLPWAGLVLQLLFAVWQSTGNMPPVLRGDSTDPLYLRAFQYRAIASQFRPALADPAVTPTPNAESPVVLAPAEFAPYLWYYARIPSVASYYWENLPGDAAAAEAFADPDPAALVAHGIVDRRRVSHLFMFEGAGDALLFDHIHTGIETQAHAARTLAATLSGAPNGLSLPSWLAVDTDLNRLANPTLYTYVPALDSFASSRFPLRIYSLMPPSP